MPSGIYSSQVLDVVKYISTELRQSVKLVAFISFRNFKSNKQKILNELPDSIVIPMFPGVHRWRYNLFTLKLLCQLKNPSMIIGRSVIATSLALQTSVKKIVYDGRGAITAEWNEYKVVNNVQLLSEIAALENEAVNTSSYRIGVSHKLIQHWKEQFGYQLNSHVIIPCTLNKVYESLHLTQGTINITREKIGVNNTAVIYVYSGSLAGWQSFNLLHDFIKPVLISSKQNKILFLCDKDENILKLEKDFPGQVICKKLNPAEVPFYLAASDYGLLIREESVTNKVASPVKFAEYLACGLKVIISQNLGDYTEFVLQHNCGYIYTNYKPTEKPTLTQKLTIRTLALLNFTKKAHEASYKQLLNHFN